MKNILILSTLFVSFSAFGQTDAEENPVRVCDIMPVLEQCANEDKDQLQPCMQLLIRELLMNEVSYPEISKEAEIEGTIYMSFIIEKDGSVGEIMFMRDIGDSEAVNSLKAEVKRALRNLPVFTPGTNKDGEAVRVKTVTTYNYPPAK